MWANTEAHYLICIPTLRQVTLQWSPSCSQTDSLQTPAPAGQPAASQVRWETQSSHSLMDGSTLAKHEAL